MEATEDELAAHFAALEDHALLQAAASRGDLTELATRVLTAEFGRRHLDLPPVAIAAPVAEEEHSSQVWVTIDRFRDLSAGIVARSALEAADIPCFLRDENTVRMDWQVSNFIGGMRLQVLQQDEDAATEILRGMTIADLSEGGDADVSDVDRCPRCGSEDVSRAARRRGFALASLIFFGLPLPRGRATWKCERCGAEWDDKA